MFAFLESGQGNLKPRIDLVTDSKYKPSGILVLVHHKSNKILKRQVICSLKTTYSPLKLELVGNKFYWTELTSNEYYQRKASSLFEIDIITGKQRNLSALLGSGSKALPLGREIQEESGKLFFSLQKSSEEFEYLAVYNIPKADQSGGRSGESLGYFELVESKYLHTNTSTTIKASRLYMELKRFSFSPKNNSIDF